MRLRIIVLCALVLLAGCANPLDSGRRDDPGCCTSPPNTDPPPPKG